MAKREPQGPQFVRYFGPVINALKELGGSGRPAEVRDKVAELLRMAESEQNETTESGQSRFNNQVAWARFYLVKAGLLDSSTRGVWSLTEEGAPNVFDSQTVSEDFQGDSPAIHF